jgi:hypothetical protein
MDSEAALVLLTRNTNLLVLVVCRVNGRTEGAAKQATHWIRKAKSTNNCRADRSRDANPGCDEGNDDMLLLLIFDHLMIMEFWRTVSNKRRFYAIKPRHGEVA